MVTYLRRLLKYEKNWKLLTNISGDLTIYITSETVAAEPDDKDDSIAELMSKVQVQEHDYYLLKVQENSPFFEIQDHRVLGRNTASRNFKLLSKI